MGMSHSALIVGGPSGGVMYRCRYRDFVVPVRTSDELTEDGLVQFDRFHYVFERIQVAERTLNCWVPMDWTRMDRTALTGRVIQWLYDRVALAGQ